MPLRDPSPRAAARGREDTAGDERRTAAVVVHRQDVDRGVHPAAERRPARPGPRWFTPERNEIECLVSTPGKLVARWHLERKIEGESGGGAIGSHVLEKHWVTLDVRDEPGVQVFVLELDGEALDGVTRGLGW